MILGDEQLAVAPVTNTKCRVYDYKYKYMTQAWLVLSCAMASHLYRSGALLY